MSQASWTFLSNHGRIFCYLATYPKCKIEGLARDAGLSVAGVHKIIDELEEAGYVVRQKVGRRNQYVVHPEPPMRHHLEWDCTVADILLAMGSLRSAKKNVSVEGIDTESANQWKPVRAVAAIARG